MTGRPVLWISMAVLITIASLAFVSQAKISLGGTQDSRQASITQGGEASFRIFLFNAHQEESLTVYLGVLSEGGMLVEVEPDVLTIPYSKPGRYREVDSGFAIIGTPQGDVKARYAEVRMSAPLSAEPGRHDVVLFAATERQEGILGSAQVRKFHFSVEIEKGGTGVTIGEGLETETGDAQATEEPDEEKPGEPDSALEPNGSVSGFDKVNEAVTGALTGIPMPGPFVLAGVVLLFIVLRILKRV